MRDLEIKKKNPTREYLRKTRQMTTENHASLKKLEKGHPIAHRLAYVAKT